MTVAIKSSGNDILWKQKGLTYHRSHRTPWSWWT